jgi:DNA repair exonuclease SbcCD ATPase subunit
MLQNTKQNLDEETKKLDDVKETLIKLEAKRKELIDEKTYYDAASILLKDTGIKTKIVRQYLPVINKLVNKYLASMDFFVNFNLDESFKETIKSRHRDEFSYASFSEGEKQRIDMALMLTWRAVAKLKNSANTNLLILDEVFDSSLDANGTEYLMNLLHLLEDVNLFVISHKGDILQDKFRSIVKFEKVNNFSRIAK